MRRMIILIAVAVLAVWGAGAALAQEWTWDEAVEVSPPLLKEIAADPSGGTLYGIDESGNVYTIDKTTGASSLLTAGGDGANDIAVGPYGEVYICTDDAIQVYDPATGGFVDLLQQPTKPATPGAFVLITVGMHGVLHVLFETTNGDTIQYLINGNPPVLTDGVDISFKPRTLNLRSRGKWVTCHIDLPEGMDEGAIDLSSIEITSISIQGLPDVPLTEPIKIAPGAPISIEKSKLIVKFIRYDKANPDNPQSLIKVLWDRVGGESGKFFRATLTVHGSVNGQYFEGSDTIKVKKGKKPPKGL